MTIQSVIAMQTPTQENALSFLDSQRRQGAAFVLSPCNAEMHTAVGEHNQKAHYDTKRKMSAIKWHI